MANLPGGVQMRNRLQMRNGTSPLPISCQRRCTGFFLRRKQPNVFAVVVPLCSWDARDPAASPNVEERAPRRIAETLAPITVRQFTHERFSRHHRASPGAKPAATRSFNADSGIRTLRPSRIVVSRPWLAHNLKVWGLTLKTAAASLYVNNRPTTRRCCSGMVMVPITASRPGTRRKRLAEVRQCRPSRTEIVQPTKISSCSCKGQSELRAHSRTPQRRC
jgi:hypothetical protein